MSRMTRMSPLTALADNILALLERKDGPMNVNLIEKLANYEHERFRLALDFLIRFNIIEYALSNQTVKLNDSLLFRQKDQKLSSWKFFSKMLQHYFKLWFLKC